MATESGGRRHLPAMHRLLELPAIAEYAAALGREPVKRAVERALDRARASADPQAAASAIAATALAELG
ncbi:MAG TPA: hypothetical protein VJP76_08885, partial [Candidatus Tumulicola sp.]|nr:hypothetical protein [Candidatus Tumulicola sp.]